MAMAGRPYRHVGTSGPNYYAADVPAEDDEAAAFPAPSSPRGHGSSPVAHEPVGASSATQGQALILYPRQELVRVTDDAKADSTGHDGLPSNDVLPSEAKAIDKYAEFFEQVSVAADERVERSANRERHPDAMVRWMKRGKRIAQMAAMVCDKFGSVAHRRHTREEARRERNRLEFEERMRVMDAEREKRQATRALEMDQRRRVVESLDSARLLQSSAPSYTYPTPMHQQNTRVHVILVPVPMSQVMRTPAPRPAAGISSVQVSEVD
jgi:hypothetical protein